MIPQGSVREWMTSKKIDSGQFYETGNYRVKKKGDEWVVEKVGSGFTVLTPWFPYVNDLKRKYGSNVDVKEHLLKD